MNPCIGALAPTARAAGARWCITVLVSIALWTTQVVAADEPVILVTRDSVTPPVIEVHPGELVRWRATAGEHLHLRLDAHPGAHEGIERSGEIRARFLLPGVHTYTVVIMADRGRTVAGTVVVKEPDVPMVQESPPTCAPGFNEICFEP